MGSWVRRRAQLWALQLLPVPVLVLLWRRRCARNRASRGADPRRW